MSPPAPLPPAAPPERGGAALAVSPRRSSSFARVAVALLLLVLTAAILLPVALFAALRSQGGSAWLLAHVPGLVVNAPRGALLGGDFSAERIEALLPGSDDLLVLEQPAWEGLTIGRSADPGTWVSVRLSRLAARSATFTSAPRPPSPATASPPPDSLRLPVSVQVDQLALGELRSNLIGAEPVRGLGARLHLGAEGGASHRVDDLRLSWDRLAASGSLQIGSDAPLPLVARLQLQPVAVAAPAAPSAPPASADPLAALDDWRADLRLSGPLAGPTLRAAAQRGDAATPPLLEATAGLRPFAAWPLADVQARARALNLAAFVSAAPRTALDADATVQASGLDQPASADIRLTNAEAGLWNEGRLPLRQLTLQLQGRPDQPQVATIQRFEAELGSTRQPAGRLNGRGGIDHGRWTVDATLVDLAPQQLDARAAAMRLGGTVTLSGEPGDAASPGVASEVNVLTARAALTGRLLASAAATPARRSKGTAARTDLTRPENARKAPRAGTGPARPAGRAVASLPEVRLNLDASARLGPAGALQLTLKQVDARAGGARAQLTGSLARSAETAPWAVRAQASLSEFDPRPWWTGAADNPWRRGPHRLNAETTLDLRWDASVPVPAGGSSPARAMSAASNRSTPSAAPASSDPTAALLAWLAPWRGEAALRLRPSVLAGVPLEGSAGLQARGADRSPVEAAINLTLAAAGNRLDASLLTRADRPAADRWQLKLDAPSLGKLAPAATLLGLLPPASTGGGVTTGPDGARVTSGPSAAALAGRMSAQASLTGRWPGVRSEGRLTADGLRAGTLALQRGELRWGLGTQGDAPADLQGNLSGLSIGTAAADAVALRLEGTARAHRWTVSADSRALPPAWAVTNGTPAAATPTAARAAPVPTPATTGPSPTRIELRGEGGLLFPGGSALAATGWRGRVQTLDARSGLGASSLGLRSRDLALELGWAAGTPTRLAVQPGRVELQAGPTVAALRWSRLAWQAAGPAGEARIDADAELEPLAVAPLLARVQPDFGWGGDLQVVGKLVLQSAPRLRADIVLERQRGDLSVTDEVGTQVLGLSDLRLALTADNGVWSLTQALAGTNVGVAAGAVVARTGSATAWPNANTPIQGVLELRVAQLGAWGPWVPAGWRLGGTLRTSASIGGRIGAPEYTGELRGNALTVRNFAEGVNVTDGEVAVRLQGSTARIETFTARAGNGNLVLSGGASFGARPEADLQLKAERFQLLGRVDRRIVASGNGRLQFDADKLTMDGQFVVDEGLIDFTRGDAPSLSDDVVVVRPPKGSGQPAAVSQQVAEQKAGAAASRIGSEAATARRAGVATAPAARPAPTRAVALNIGVNLGQQLRLRGRGLDTGLRGELRITSPAGRMAVNGTVSTQDGTYQAYGQKLTIDRGSIVFTGLVENPRLDIEATRPNTDVRVGVTVGGSAANPRIRLFSQPDLPEVDKLSWLVLGRATDGLGRTDTALLQRAAIALLSGEGPGVTDRVTKAIGLDEVSLRQSDGEVRETVISLGKQISRRWYVGYERGLNATTGSWQLIYRIAQRLTLRAQSGLENAIDLNWTWRWQ